MLDTRNRTPYRELAQECRRLATTAASSRIKNRYLLMAQDYLWLAEQAHACGTPAALDENTAWAVSMSGCFPGPWRIVEIPHGFAVDDASGQQLAVFCGLAEPDTARPTDFLTYDEARQMAVDFAQVSKRLEQTLGELATSVADDRLAKLETNRSPEGALETWRLPRVAQLPAVAGKTLGKAPTAVAKSTSFEPDAWMSTPLLPQRSDRLSNRKKFLIAIGVAIAVAAPSAGYFMVGQSDRPVGVAAVPRPASDVSPVEALPLREAQAPAAAGTNVESRGPEVEPPSLQQTAPSDTKPTKSAIEAKPPAPLPEKGALAAGRDASTCFSSASAVRESSPGAWPSWTFRAPGHEGTRCWYAATRGTAHEHR